MAIRAALFDMDGTIYDSGIDWRRLRREIDLPSDGRPILEQLADAPDEVRNRGTRLLHEAEALGASDGALIEGTEELLAMLHRRGIPCALITNNSRRSVETVLSKHELRFDVVFSRDDGPSKPAPDLFLAALARLGVPPADALVIGDAHLDAIAASAAGIPRVVLVGTPEWMKEHLPKGLNHHEADDLYETREIVSRILDGSADVR